MPDSDHNRYYLSLLIFVIICIVLVLGIANALPSYDLSVSSLFCGPTGEAAGAVASSACTGFPAASMPMLQFIRKILFYLPPFAFVALLVAIGRAGLRLGSAADAGRLRHQIYAAVAYLVGPIVITNMILKDWSGRPRPYESLQFGGDLLFVPAGNFTGACPQNCSFVSGEAAAAAWLLCLIPLVGGKYRPPLLAAIIAAALLTPVLRVVMGGHYISDAMLGWLVGAAAFPLVVIAAAAIRYNRKRLAHRIA